MSNLPGFLDFTRPGPGFVDDSQLHPFVRFWKRYGRHFFKLLQVNLVYALVTLPVYGWLMSLINAVTTQTGGGVVSVLGSLLLYVALGWPVWLRAALVGGSILLLGPATAALGRAALDCAWSRPGLFWTNFWEAWRRSWRQALPVGLADVLAVFATLYYLVDGETFFGAAGGVLKVLWLALALVYAIARVYVYPIMATVELPLGALLRDSLALALLRPWRPLAVVGITAVLCALCLAADLVLIPCFLYSFAAFSAAFFTQPVIQEHLLAPAARAEEGNEES